MKEKSIEFIINSLNETQDTIRAYDVKAEILALIITLALSLLSQNFNEKLCCSNWQILTGIGAIISGLISISFVGLVLYPSKEPFSKIDISDFSPHRTYFVNTDNYSQKIKVSSYVERLENTDFVFELSYELLKCSSIRDRKHFWFVYSLRLAGLTICLSSVFWIGMISNVK